MYKIIRLATTKLLPNHSHPVKSPIIRTFLSNAYYCEDVWNQRLKSPVLQKVNLEELYYEIEQSFNKNRQLNALDIDIFANALQDESLYNELLDVVHKLRLTADTNNTLDSTSHAVVRALLQFGKIDDLLNALDDRLNYGLFLDYYTANILMDCFWKSKSYASGARVASQLMLQEEFEHPLSCNFSLLHCYNYLLNPVGWPEYVPPPEPEEEIKIRVKYIRNPYDDEHFDLRDAQKIVGKTLSMFSKNKSDPLHQSFRILGLVLFGKDEQAQKVITACNNPLYSEILKLVPKESSVHENLTNIKTVSDNVQEILIENVKKSVENTSEKDISLQCEIFEKWCNDRSSRMEQQKERLRTAKRLQTVDDLQKILKDKEEKLWFFENEEQIDLEIDSRTKFYPKRWFGNKRPPKQVDAGYVPPEVQKKIENIT
ncbi:hypothetical protein ABEB36_005039 [Hypothenemus hampei]|uniref:Mitochondrial 28S ribosomal protein S27 n=1 Tax=Hypothenemus hampei TaxID=57062 RepID=A0ABD1EZ83_HYPHA